MKEDTQKALLESDPAFACFLQRVRKERNIYLEQLAEGLMSASLQESKRGSARFTKI